MKTKRFNIALIPDKEAFEYAVKASNILSKLEKYHYILDGENFFPHITLYSPEFPYRNLDKIIKELRNISKSFEPIEIKFSEVKSIRNYAGVDIQKNISIYSLHEKIVDKLNPLREGILRDKYKNKDVLETYSQTAN